MSAKKPAARKPVTNADLGIGAQPVDEVVRDHDDKEVKFDGQPSMAKQLNDIADYFRDTMPDDWAELALCPLQHALPVMAHKLAARG